MESKVNKCRSLPPLVEGKNHGYLKLVIDEIVWARNNLCDVIVIASWWGEVNGAHFRLLDITKGLPKSEDTEETYTIKTNFQLFEDYILNCESLELIIKAEKTKQVIGRADVIDLVDIFKSKPFTRYFPIIDTKKKKIGSIHVAINLADTISSEKVSVKTQSNQKIEFNSDINVNKNIFNKKNENILNPKVDHLFPLLNKTQEENMYKSILKEKRIEFVEPIEEFNDEIPERFIENATVKTKKLKSALLKEALIDDSYIFNTRKALYENCHADICPEKEAKLYEYFLGKDMNHIDERAALETLRSTSPTPSLIEFATESLYCCQSDNIQVVEKKKTNFIKHNEIEEIKAFNENPSTEFKTRVISPLNYVDSLQIIVRLLNLTPAGYRRVKSSCLSRENNASTSVTYFVQYDSITSNLDQLRKKYIDEKKPVKMSSRKQVDQEVYFNHQGVYNISKSFAYMDRPLKFKVFHRHLNQRSPTLLGMGSMNVNDVVLTKHLSMTERIAIINKGIKVGELEVTVELGCDGIHFGQEFVDAVTSTKENIPVTGSLSSLNTKVKKFRSATGTHSNVNSEVSSASSRRMDCVSNTGNAGTSDGRSFSGRRKQTGEERNVEISIPDSKSEGKVLLHGLIYIAEGKDLSESNTYLICRAFWREDRSASQICSNTKNPSYHFHQLVPLIHGTDLLERTKDNFIVTEVYHRNSMGQDDLLGIAKFPVHQLYVAYRDSHVLPHLLLSKYPVISVDGWVPIKDPVSGQSRGQLLGLVAVGTAEQIALLEMTRGIRDSVFTSPASFESSKSSQKNPHHSSEVSCKNSTPSNQQNIEVEVQATQSVSSKSKECQTELSTPEAFKNTDSTVAEASDALNNQSQVLHTIVDCLAQALHVSRTNISQASQTESPSGNDLKNEIEPLCSDPMSISLSDNSSDGSPRNNYTIPTEMYRSVGVGAEYDDISNQGPSRDYNGAVAASSNTLNPLINEQMESDRLHYEDLSFRAVVEIECALHLPKVEKISGAIEPSTYVTFQGAPNGIKDQFNSYIITNVCSPTCNPKWEWRCDTRLPADLLTNDEKRLILKVWRLFDPDIYIGVDLEKDIVIGFAAIDLSVLTAGFPLVSGWFHIMDFTGRCNGQMKVSITPLESTTAFGKSVSSNSITKMPSEPSQSNQSNESSPRAKTMRFHNRDDHNASMISTHSNLEPFNFPLVDEPMPDIGLGFGDISLSFLSQSLKTKLTELDEITKRLQSRLHGVTENAFDDDFDDFEVNERATEPEYNEIQTGNTNFSESVDIAMNTRDIYPPPTNTSYSPEMNLPSYRNSNPSTSNDFHNHRSASSVTITATMDTNESDTGYSTSCRARPSHYILNDSNSHSVHSSDREEEHPIKGTKMHVNHLLDKLSAQLNTPPAVPVGMLPMKINIMEFLSNLQPNNNYYFQNDRSRHQFNSSQDQCNSQESETRSRINQDDVSTRSQEIFNRRTRDQNSTVSQSNVEEMTSSQSEENLTSSIQTPVQSQTGHCKSESLVSSTSQNKNKISNVIREELAEEDENETEAFDELSTHLMAANARHVDIDSVFNPLLYQHLLPDLQIASPTAINCSVSQDVQNRNTTPEGEAVRQLDNRYTETFNAAINNGLSRLRNLIERNTLANSENNSQNQVLFENDSSEVFRLTPAGISEDIDENIDVTVVHRPSIDDVMASNSSESISLVLIDKMHNDKQPETDDENTLTISESSASTISRQAPDGGNPIEETEKRSSRNGDSQASGFKS